MSLCPRHTRRNPDAAFPSDFIDITGRRGAIQRDDVIEQAREVLGSRNRRWEPHRHPRFGRKSDSSRSAVQPGLGLTITPRAYVRYEDGLRSRRCELSIRGPFMAYSHKAVRGFPNTKAISCSELAPSLTASDTRSELLLGKSAFDLTLSHMKRLARLV